MENKKVKRITQYKTIGIQWFWHTWSNLRNIQQPMESELLLNQNGDKTK